MAKTVRTKRPARRQFPRTIAAAADEAKIFGVRAGGRSEHRFIGIWCVVIDGRIFGRSWTLKKDGWYRSFLDDPLGTIQIGDRELRARAVQVRSERLRDAVDRAYAEKYVTPGARKYVRGFRSPRRREATIEFVPR